jgi:hypothetical protein
MISPTYHRMHTVSRKRAYEAILGGGGAKTAWLRGNGAVAILQQGSGEMQRGPVPAAFPQTAISNERGQA